MKYPVEIPAYFGYAVPFERIRIINSSVQHNYCCSVLNRFNQFLIHNFARDRTQGPTHFCALLQKRLPPGLRFFEGEPPQELRSRFAHAELPSHIQSRGSSAVTNNRGYIERLVDSYGSDNIYAAKGDQWPIGFQQRTICNFIRLCGSFGGDFGGIGLLDRSLGLAASSFNQSIGLLTSGLHFSQLLAHSLQLPLHGFPVFSQHAPLEKTNTSNDGSKNRYPNSGISGISGRMIGGIFAGLFRAALMKLAFYVMDEPQPPPLFKFIGILLFALVFVGISGGVVLIASTPQDSCDYCSGT